MKINRSASAAWAGGLRDDKGSITTESGALSAYPYGFASRFEGVKGTNPEELLGAAHAGCFTMALSLILGEAKFTAEQMDTAAKVTLEQIDAIFSKSRKAGHATDIRTWGDLGLTGEWANKPIALYGRNSASGTSASCACRSTARA